MKKRSKEMAEVLKIAAKLQPIFLLQGWDIEVRIIKEADPDQENVAAKMKSQNCYKTATLSIYPPFFRESVESKRDIIVHEFCHIMSGIQNGLLNTARQSIQVSPQEAIYAYEEETSWFALIISSLL